MRIFSPEWESVSCHLCGRGQAEASPVTVHGRPLTQGQFGYEVHPLLCPCGLIYLNPRWTAASYGDFYSHHYDALYRLETKPDYGQAGVRQHMRQVWERVKSRVAHQTITSVLDAGCGSGYGLQYLKEERPDLALFGIEASPECCRILQDEVGATLLDSDIDGPWLTAHQGRFDLIILRHVVEHFLTPPTTLALLRTTLSPTGLLYIAVPDMMHPRTVLRDYQQWWEYWFRAVHPYYYSRQTLFATLDQAGLGPLAFGEEGEEVWCLAEATTHPWPAEADLFAAQSGLLKQLLPATPGR